MLAEKSAEPFDLIILAGGLATRLGPIAAWTPKALLPIAGIPFIALQLAQASRHGRPRRVILTVRPETVAQFRSICNKLDYTIEIIEENKSMGTGGAILNALAFAGLSDPFVVANGDVFFAMDIPKLCQAAKKTGAALAAIEVPDVARFGTLNVESDLVTVFREKGATGPGLVSAGLYAFTKASLQSFAQGPQSFETAIAPALAAKGILSVVMMPGPFIDIGTPESFAAAPAFIERFAA